MTTSSSLRKESATKVQLYVGTVLRASWSVPGSVLSKDVARLSTSAPVSVNYCLWRLLIELAHLDGPMGTQVNIKQERHHQESALSVRLLPQRHTFFICIY